MAPPVKDEDDDLHGTPRYSITRHLAADVQQLKTRFDDFGHRLQLVENADRRFEERVEAIKTSVNTKIDDLSKAFTADVAERKSERTWLFRTIVGAVLLAIATFVMSGGLKMIGTTFGG